MYHKNVKRNMGFLALILILVSLTIGYSKIETKTTNEGVGVVEVYAGPVLAVTYDGDIRAFRSDTYREKIKTITLADEINIPSDITCGKIDSVDVTCWDVSADQNGWVMAYILPNAEDTSMYDLYIQGNGTLIANQDSSFLFARFTNLVEINNMPILDTSNVINMFGMFLNDNSLISLDLSNFDTSNVTTMSHMFYGVSGLTSLELGNFDTSNVTDMSWMFWNSTGLENLDVSSFDTSKVTNMHRMFGNLASLKELNLSNFDTSDVTDMSYMFCNLDDLTSLDLSSFDISNVINMEYMFSKNVLSTNEIILNKTPFNTSVSTTNMFGTISYTIMVNSQADKLLLDNLGYSNVEVIVG